MMMTEQCPHGVRLSAEGICRECAVIWNRQTTHTPPTEAQKRKAAPVTTGFLWYFPRAIRAAARVSKAGNDQHNPGQPLHWARGKSTDHEDCAGRHLMDHGVSPIDTDDMPHLAKAFWRCGAALETWLETAEGRAWFEKECGK